MTVSEKDKKLYILIFFNNDEKIPGFIEILQEDYLLSMAGNGDYEHN